LLAFLIDSPLRFSVPLWGRFCLFIIAAYTLQFAAYTLQFSESGWRKTVIQMTRPLPRYAEQRELEVAAMAKDERDILELLKEELDFIEKGGYGRSVRTPWQPKSAFQDSLTCINYGYPYRAHLCTECHLIDFVAPEHQAETVPCHFIKLNAAGETIEDLESEDNQPKLEAALKDWLRAKINEIEAQRASQTTGL
jgi:hypothetical protein